MADSDNPFLVASDVPMNVQEGSIFNPNAFNPFLAPFSPTQNSASNAQEDDEEESSSEDSDEPLTHIANDPTAPKLDGGEGEDGDGEEDGEDGDDSEGSNESDSDEDEEGNQISSYSAPLLGPIVSASTDEKVDANGKKEQGIKQSKEGKSEEKSDEKSDEKNEDKGKKKDGKSAKSNQVPSGVSRSTSQPAKTTKVKDRNSTRTPVSPRNPDAGVIQAPVQPQAPQPTPQPLAANSSNTSNAAPTAASLATVSPTVLPVPLEVKKMGMPELLPDKLRFWKIADSGAKELVLSIPLTSCKIEQKSEKKSFKIILRNTKTKDVICKMSFNSGVDLEIWNEALVMAMSGKLVGTVIVRDSPTGKSSPNLQKAQSVAPRSVSSVANATSPVTSPRTSAVLSSPAILPSPSPNVTPIPISGVSSASVGGSVIGSAPAPVVPTNNNKARNSSKGKKKTLPANQWYWAGDNGYEKYEPAVNALIQNSYANKDPELAIHLPHGVYKIFFNLKPMRQQNEKTAGVRKIKCDDKKNREPISVPGQPVNSLANSTGGSSGSLANSTGSSLSMSSGNSNGISANSTPLISSGSSTPLGISGQSLPTSSSSDAVPRASGKSKTRKPLPTPPTAVQQATAPTTSAQLIPDTPPPPYGAAPSQGSGNPPPGGVSVLPPPSYGSSPSGHPTGNPPAGGVAVMPQVHQTPIASGSSSPAITPPVGGVSVMPPPPAYGNTPSSQQNTGHPTGNPPAGGVAVIPQAPNSNGSSPYNTPQNNYSTPGQGQGQQAPQIAPGVTPYIQGGFMYQFYFKDRNSGNIFPYETSINTVLVQSLLSGVASYDIVVKGTKFTFDFRNGKQISEKSVLDIACQQMPLPYPNNGQPGQQGNANPPAPNQSGQLTPMPSQSSQPVIPPTAATPPPSNSTPPPSSQPSGGQHQGGSSSRQSKVKSKASTPTPQVLAPEPLPPAQPSSASSNSSNSSAASSAFPPLPVLAVGKFQLNEEWIWYDGSKFHKFSKDTSQLINAKILKGEPSFHIKPKGGGKYLFDIDIMLQTNSRTKEQRILSTTEREEFIKDLAASHSWIPRIPLKPAAADEQNLSLIRLQENDPEYNCVKVLFNLSVTRPIVSIEKIINYRIRQQYNLELEQVGDKNRNNNTVKYLTRLLFHGTKNTEPSVIYNGEKGFMMQFAAEGYWGRGTYFAEKACYSHHYSSTPAKDSGVRQMFLAEVIVGDAKFLKPDKSLIVPPEKPKKEASSNLAVERYDSVAGITGGSRVWIVYDNNKAYPTYLITYKSTTK